MSALKENSRTVKLELMMQSNLSTFLQEITLSSGESFNSLFVQDLPGPAEVGTEMRSYLKYFAIM